MQKHRRSGAGSLTLLVVTVLLSVAFMEFLSRQLILFDIKYYMDTTVPGRNTFPYGDIYVNSDGFPDEEFDADDARARIGYFGDSVTFGIGAGAGYRFHDLIEERSPQFHHWAFAGIAQGLTYKNIDKIMDLTARFNLQTIIYAFNLNDISEDNISSPYSSDPGQNFLGTLSDFCEKYFGFMEETSALYALVRKGAAVGLFKLGFDRIREEHFPSKYQKAVLATAGRVNYLAFLLAERNIKFCVILLPYEMQISVEAEKIYRDLGIRWEDGFAEGKTQEMIKQRLDRTIEVADTINAFGKKTDNAVGEYFVFDRGVSIDWNHPNRAGHRRIADFLERIGFCGIFEHETGAN